MSLRYDGQTENIIANLNLVIPAGQRLGICGRTGSGKSTLALALFRAVEITSGRILIDDVDISGIHTDEIRTRLSIIPQDVMLFSGTIRENLDPCGHYADLDLLNSLESARLKQTIVTLPLGLDTPIVDNGNTIFSCGEKQLFCLARAVLRGTVCLVLDEATSSLDGATEIALLETASKAFHGRTIITIAVRIRMLANSIECLQNDLIESHSVCVSVCVASINHTLELRSNSCHGEWRHCRRRNTSRAAYKVRWQILNNVILINTR